MIEAMKHALEALEDYRSGCQTKYDADKAITFLRQAIAEAEKQEPIGYLWPTGMHPEFRYSQQKRNGADGTPVYISPPPVTEAHKRQWVGLDNDDLIYIYNHADKSVGRAIELTEAKLKEKNT